MPSQEFSSLPSTRSSRIGTKDIKFSKATDRHMMKFINESDDISPIIANNPALHKRVIIIGGKNVGLKGKLVKIEKRGWCTIDNPQLGEKKVARRFCKLLDGMDVSKVNMYESMTRTPRSHQPPTDIRQEGQSKVSNGEKKAVEVGIMDFERKFEPKAKASFVRQETKKKKSRRVLSHQAGKRKRPTSRSNTCIKERSITFCLPTISGAISGACPSEKFSLDEKQRYYGRKSALNQAHQNHDDVSPEILHPQANDHHFFEPLGSFSHLQPDSRVDIFNKKTGRIMKGENGIKVKDLTNALSNHAEYEPIIRQHPSPQLKATKDNFSYDIVSKISVKNQQSCITGSSTSSRISAPIKPQGKAFKSTSKGHIARVTDGPYRGLNGRVEACVSGSWYIVSNLLENDEFGIDVIVHEKQLQLLPDEAIGMKKQNRVDFVSEDSFDNEESKKKKIEIGDLLEKTNLESIRHRISALNEEKAIIKNCIEVRSAKKTLYFDQNLSDLQGSLNKVDSAILKAQSALKTFLFESSKKNPDSVTTNSA